MLSYFGFYYFILIYIFIAYYLYFILVLVDFLDGFLARKFNATSIIGKALDPIADKIFTSTVLITFITDSRANFIVVSAIIMRELIIAGLRETLSNYKQIKFTRGNFFI